MSNTRKYDWPALIAEKVAMALHNFCRDNKLTSKSFYNNRVRLCAPQTTTAFIKVETQVSQ